MSAIVAESPTEVKGVCENILAHQPISLLSGWSGLPMADRRDDLKAPYLLRENIRSLLLARKEEQKTLAQWCGHDKSWINKFLNEGRGLQLADLDGIASFFGLATYQLFQPGISALTERRTAVSRRSGRDRRVGHQGRELYYLRENLGKAPRLQSTEPSPHVGVAVLAALPPELRRIVEQTNQAIRAYVAAHPDQATSAAPAEVSDPVTNRRRTHRQSSKVKLGR